MKNKKNRKNRKRLIAFFVIIFFVGFIGVGFYNPLKIAKYRIHSDKVTEKVSIAFVADLHSSDFGDKQKTLMEAIDQQKPDVVLLGGDIIDNHRSQKKAKEFLELITQKYQTYYVSGNHEYWTNDIGRIKKIVKGYGIPVLEGQCIPLQINNQKINLCGIDDPEVGEREFRRQLEICSVDRQKDTFSILLTHRPECTDMYLRYEYDLILSGHTHGGQWRIPGIINGLFAPNQGWFPKYGGGRYNFENSVMIVSRGLAETTRYPRIYNRPELVTIEISK